MEIEKETGIDNKPIVNPNAFAYLNKPDLPRKEDEEVLQPPRIVVPLSNIHTVEGKPCRLVCRIEGIPKPTVHWFKNGIVLPASNRYTPHFDLKSGVASLKINEAQPNDSGSYEVIAENKVGQDRTQANLIVDQSPSIDQTPIVDPKAFRYLNSLQTPSHGPTDNEDAAKYTPPKVVIPLKDVRINEGESANLLAKIVGYPIPSVSDF